MTPPDDEAPDRSSGDGASQGFADRPEHPSTEEAAERGLETYRKADEAGDPAGAYNLGVVLQTKGEMEEAEEAFRRADERGHPMAPYALGEMLEERGDHEAAREAFERSADRDYERARLRLEAQEKE
jgi:TPR repeat protein